MCSSFFFFLFLLKKTTKHVDIHIKFHTFEEAKYMESFLLFSKIIVRPGKKKKPPKRK